MREVKGELLDWGYVVPALLDMVGVPQDSVCCNGYWATKGSSKRTEDKAESEQRKSNSVVSTRHQNSKSLIATIGISVGAPN